MALALEFFFDKAADTAVRDLWQNLEQVGVPSLASKSHQRHRPHLSFAVGSDFPAAIRAELTRQLALLSLPSVWLSVLSLFQARENATIVLTSVVDTELLAVHSAVHDVLAGKVKNPSAYYLPGSWVPHCTLAMEINPTKLGAAVAALHPIAPIRAKLVEVGLVDTRNGDTTLLLTK